ncbi:hypothetical protein AB5I41_13360 [Sphingomonas sp. MMS24-JH45]
METRIAWRARADDDVLGVVALDFGLETDAFALDAIAHHPAGGWRDYVRGMVAPARRARRVGARDRPGDRRRHPARRGAVLLCSSLEVAVGHAMAAAAGLLVDAAAMALTAQAAENDFVGMKCGVMDQLASAASVAGTALLIDCRSLATRAIPVPADAAILIVHSGVARGLVEGHYNRRRAECDEAARLLGVPALRDADAAAVARAAMPADIAARARHVVGENARVLAAADCLSRRPRRHGAANGGE